MKNISPRSLKALAAIAWCSGGVVLLVKGSTLLLAARDLDPRSWLPWFAVTCGVLAGIAKVIFLFDRFCQRNLDRIDALEHPKPWQFFRPGFMAFLAAMIVLGATLSRLALDSYSLLLGVIALDFSLATALLGSSRAFWRS